MDIESVNIGTVLRVVDGYYKGAVGEVVELSEAGVSLDIRGIVEGEVVDGVFFFEFDQLGRNHGQA